MWSRGLTKYVVSVNLSSEEDLVTTDRKLKGAFSNNSNSLKVCATKPLVLRKLALDCHMHILIKSITLHVPFYCYTSNSTINS